MPPPRDRTAPKVGIAVASTRVSPRGDLAVRIRCPRTETRCTVTVRIELAGKTVARGTRTLAGGATRTFTLRLTKVARLRLVARGRTRMTVVVGARDAAGNARTARVAVTLRAPKR